VVSNLSCALEMVHPACGAAPGGRACCAHRRGEPPAPQGPAWSCRFAEPGEKRAGQECGTLVPSAHSVPGEEKQTAEPHLISLYLFNFFSLIRGDGGLSSRDPSAGPRRSCACSPMQGWRCWEEEEALLPAGLQTLGSQSRRTECVVETASCLMSGSEKLQRGLGSPFCLPTPESQPGPDWHLTPGPDGRLKGPWENSALAGCCQLSVSHSMKNISPPPAMPSPSLPWPASAA